MSEKVELRRRTPEERAAYWEGRYWELKARLDELTEPQTEECRHRWTIDAVGGQRCITCGYYEPSKLDRRLMERSDA